MLTLQRPLLALQQFSGSLLLIVLTNDCVSLPTLFLDKMTTEKDALCTMNEVAVWRHFHCEIPKLLGLKPNKLKTSELLYKVAERLGIIEGMMERLKDHAENFGYDSIEDFYAAYSERHV